MSKAGDYVETAADRAAQANVSLQNKMEELGRKFAPLEEASNSLWTSMKIGILDVVGGPLTDLLNKLTQAGRMANQYGLMGGNAKVGRMTSNLASASEGNRQSIYQQQQAQFWKYINPREQQLKDIRAWQSGDRNEALQKRIGDITEKYGSLDATKIQAEVDAAKKMLSDYQAAAKQILQPIEQKIVPTVGDGGNSGGGGGRSGRSSSSKSEPTFAPDSIAAQQKLVSDLTRQWNEAGAEVRNQYVVPLVEAEAKLKEMRDQQALMKEQAQGKLLGDTSDGKGIEVPISSNASFEEWMNSVKEQLANLKIDPIEIPIETTKKDVMAIAKSASITADVVGSIGDAFNAIEDPAAKVAGTVAQAIASVAMGYAQATVAASQTGNPWVWAAFAMSGLATMITMISQIHSATGYAEGGMIKGNSYSGDNIGGLVDGSQLVGLNAGEVVLNAAQQNNLAQSLQGGGSTVNVVGRVVGEDIFLSADRYARRSGRGSILTGKNL
jgi:hypothetical protein